MIDSIQKMMTSSDCGPVAIAMYLQSIKLFVAIQIYARIISLMSYPNTEDWKDDACDNPFHHLSVISELTGRMPGIKHGTPTADNYVALLYTNQGTWHWVACSPGRWFDGHKYMDGSPSDFGHTILLSYSLEYSHSIFTPLYVLYHVLVICILETIRMAGRL